MLYPMFTFMWFATNSNRGIVTPRFAALALLDKIPLVICDGLLFLMLQMSSLRNLQTYEGQSIVLALIQLCYFLVYIWCLVSPSICSTVSEFLEVVSYPNISPGHMLLYIQFGTQVRKGLQFERLLNAGP